jgi:hypothetical protein
MNLSPIEDLSQLNSASLIKEADQIIESIESSWPKTSTHNYNLNNGTLVSVPVYKTTLNNESWCARVSDFREFDDEFKNRYYDNFVKYIIGSLTDLTKTHSEYETKYVHEVYDYKVTPVELDGSTPGTLTYLLEAYYKFQFPLKKRVFYELIIVHMPKQPTKTTDLPTKTTNELDLVIKMTNETKTTNEPELTINSSKSPAIGGNRESNTSLSVGLVVSLPINPKRIKDLKPNNFVVAKYTSIEKFTFNHETNNLKWSMCTCSTPAGSIPRWLVEMSIGGAVAKDVPGFINFCESL